MGELDKDAVEELLLVKVGVAELDAVNVTLTLRDAVLLPEAVVVSVADGVAVKDGVRERVTVPLGVEDEDGDGLATAYKSAASEPKYTVLSAPMAAEERTLPATSSFHRTLPDAPLRATNEASMLPT